MRLKSDTFSTLSNFFAYVYVSTHFSRIIVQCDECKFDNFSFRAFSLSHGVFLWCLVRTLHLRMVKSSELSILLTMSSATSCFKLWFLQYLPMRTFMFLIVCYPNLSATIALCSLHDHLVVFLGYSSDHKGYQCLDLSTNCIIVLRHVAFDKVDFSLSAPSRLTNDLDIFKTWYISSNSAPMPMPLLASVVMPGFPPLSAPALRVPPSFAPLLVVHPHTVLRSASASSVTTHVWLPFKCTCVGPQAYSNIEDCSCGVVVSPLGFHNGRCPLYIF
jgi:hypothetical protein